MGCLWCCLCLCGVPRSGRMTCFLTCSCTAPALSRSPCCPCQRLPSSPWRTVPVRTARFLVMKMLTKTSDSSQWWLWCMDVLPRGCPCRCAMCKNPLFSLSFTTGCIFHLKKRTKTDMNIFYFGFPSPYYDSWEKKRHFET